MNLRNGKSTQYKKINKNKQKISIKSSTLSNETHSALNYRESSAFLGLSLGLGIGLGFGLGLGGGLGLGLGLRLGFGLSLMLGLGLGLELQKTNNIFKNAFNTICCLLNYIYKIVMFLVFYIDCLLYSIFICCCIFCALGLIIYLIKTSFYISVVIVYLLKTMIVNYF